MAATSGGKELPPSSTKSVVFANLPDTENVELRQNKNDPTYAKVRHDTKDEKLYKTIVEDLGREGHQRVFLTGKTGIGKTRLAKMVAEYATSNRLCFLTICLHLNKKFEREFSLYENIASQLSFYSDFEETEVDDRDEDEEEEKKLDENDFKKMIIDGILKQKSESDIEKGKADKRNKDEADKTNKNTPDKKDKTTLLEKKTPTQGANKPYLLLILDDEGNKTTENAVMKGFKLEEFLKDLLLKLEEFLNELLRKEDLLKDMLLKDPLIFKVDTNLKVLVTRRRGFEEATKTQQGDNSTTESKTELAGEIVLHDANSEHKNDDQDNTIKSDSKPERAGEIQLHDTKSEGATAAQSTQSAVSDGGSGPSTGASSNVETKYDTTNRSDDLLNTINEDNLRDLFWSLTTKEDWKTYEEFIPEIVKKSKNSPAAIVVLANSLTWITQSKKRPSTSDEEKKKELNLKEKIDQKIREVLSADRSVPSESGSSSESGINPILYLAYELLETNQINRLSMDAILDCFWHSLDFFEQCGCVYYRDLITQWILEGYFDPVKSVEKAYQNGHSILMELINRRMLKIQENNVVVPEMAMINLIDPRRRGHLGRSRLGFSRVYGGNKEKGIGKITQLDDMIKTVQAKKGDNMTTILVGGDRLRRETPGKYFANLAHLEVLGLFEPTVEPFVQSFTNRLKLLRVLVIRDCDLLDSIEDLKTLTELNALEVSGASSLNNISDGFFKAFRELQSLHLSELQITSSPSSISELKKLHCLIIKDCPLLEDLPNIQELEDLEIVDISGARGLQTCFDNTKGEKKDKSKNKNFYNLKKLQLLDFSESQIERLPIFQDSAVAAEIHSLTRLLLRNCSKLRRLPSLKPLSGLQILDLSGTTSLVEMLEVCFENKKELKTLDLSGTNLSELATTIEELSSLNKLLLMNCINLENIPNIQGLTNLEVIDVSGSTKLTTIEGSFEGMSYLREVNLFRTKVETPELPKESKIHCLKRITLADGRYFEGKDWNEVRKNMSSASEDPSSSNAVVESKKISEETGEIQSVEPRASDCTEKGDVSRERLLQVPRDKAIYKMALSLVASASPQEVMEIYETNELDVEALNNAEFLSFVNCSSTRLTSIFNMTKSVKGCWLRMCIDIKDLLSGVEEERLGLLETLSITNLPSLETISCVASFKNLNKLSIDCCPNIITLFPEASELPISLKDLHIKDCEKLEKVVKGVEVSTLTNLTVKPENCPKYNENSISSDYVMVEHSDASLQI